MTDRTPEPANEPANEPDVDPVDATTEADVSDGREQKQPPVE